jgi:hypothetical protein
MLKINESKIIKNYNNNNIIRSNTADPWRACPGSGARSLRKTPCNFLDYYLKDYIEFIESKKLIKNYKIINEPDDIDLYKFVYKKYLPKEQIFLGEGVYGKVYKLNNNIAVKIENLPSNSYSLKQKLDEIKISKIAGKHNIGPKIYKNKIIFNSFNASFYCLTYMEYIEGITFNKYKNSLNKSNDMINKINAIIKTKKKLLHKLGFMHNDLHGENIIINIKNNKIIYVYIIDFGRSKKINNMNNYYINNYKNYELKLNYFINKKYIEVFCNNNIIDQINKIYNNILLNKNNGIKSSTSIDYINNIYNINLLSDEIINKFVNLKNHNKSWKDGTVNRLLNSIKNKNKEKQLNKMIKIVSKEDEFIENKYVIEKEILKDDIIKYYNFFINNYDHFFLLFKMYQCKDLNNNKYLCIIYNLGNRDINDFIEDIKYGFNILKILHKNKLGLNFIDYNFMKYNDDLMMSYYIKLKKNTNLNNFISISKKKIQNYIEDFIKKIIDLKIYFKYSSINYIAQNFFLYNNNIYYYTLLNFSKIKDLLKDEQSYIENVLNNNQKIEFINQLIQNNLIIIK